MSETLPCPITVCAIRIPEEQSHHSYPSATALGPSTVTRLTQDGKLGLKGSAACLLVLEFPLLISCYVKGKGIMLMLGMVVAPGNFGFLEALEQTFPLPPWQLLTTPRLLEKRKHFSAGIFLSLNLHGNIRRKEY